MRLVRRIARSLTLLFPLALAAGGAASGVACLSSDSNDAGVPEAPSSGACWGPKNVFCYAWTNVPPSVADGSCASADAGGGGIGKCPTANATSTCTMTQDAGSYSVTTYTPNTTCEEAKSSCTNGTFTGC